jgi:adenosine deaminase
LQDKLKIDENTERYLYRLFSFLASEHFNDSGGKIVLDIDFIDEFQSLVNSIDMTPIYAAAVDRYISHYSQRDKSIYVNESISNTILSYPARFNFLTMVSDNHFHLGGSLHITYRLNELFKNPSLLHKVGNRPIGHELNRIEEKSDIRLIVWAASSIEDIIYTYLVKKDFYDIELLRSHLNYAMTMIAEKIVDHKWAFRDAYTKDVKGEEEHFHFISFRQDIIDKSFFHRKTYRATLISEIYHSHQKGELQKSDKLFWLLIVDYLKSGKNRTLIDIIYLYTILRNVIRKYIIQQHFKEGLTYFSSVSRSDVRRSKIRQEYLDSFRSIFLPSFNINIEGRINFQDTERDLAQEMHNWLESFLIVEYENTQKLYKENQLSFLLHFQKRKDEIAEDRYDLRYACRHKDYRIEIFKKTEVFFKFLRSPDYKRYRIPLMTSENLQRLQKKFHDLDCLESKKELNDYEKNKLERLRHLNLHKHLFINKKYCQNGFISAVEVDLTRFISGVDAASKENTASPEVFAPVFNYIRSSIEISRISFENKANVENYDDAPKHFQFTFHAGEDFRDIVTGMRNVLEAVLFLGLNKGDRVGHALALGLGHKQWARKKRRIFTTKEEQFDNAVFAYFVITSFSNYRDLAKKFYQKAMMLGNELYHENYTIDNYINAWLLRRNCPINLKEYLDRIHLERSQEQGEIKEYDFYKDGAKRCAKTSMEPGYKEYHTSNFRHLTQSKLYFEKSMPDLFKYPETYYDDLSTRYDWAQTDAYAWEIFLKYHYDNKLKKRAKKKIEEPMRDIKDTEVLQDIILENIISKRDLIIEVMPSSNVLNSYIEDYYNHPIFRFKPVDSFDDFNKYELRKNPVRVIINTDNPGFQATSYINELFLIYNAAIKLGYSNEKVESYIREIVNLGNSIFNNKASQE